MTNAETILIADGRADRAESLARAFEATGRTATIAAHGAAALEIALSTPPRLLIVHADLPLVDAAKLAEILRANPRTRHVPFLVLGREARRGGLAPIGDEWIDEATAADAVVSAAARMLERQARVDQLELGAHAATRLEGSLQDLRPAELVLMLHQRRATGGLTLHGGSKASAVGPARLRFANGELQGVELAGVHGEKALFRVLEWAEGEFAFEPGPVEGPAALKLPTRALLAEARRQHEEWLRLASKLPPVESPVRLRVARAGLPPVLHPLTQEVLELIEQATCVGDVVDRSAQPDYQVLRTLHTLAERGIVEFGRARLAPPEAVAHALFSEAQVRRLRGFVQAERRAGAALPNAKLLVVAANDGAIRRFATLLEKVPGAELAPALPRDGSGRDPKRPLTALGRLAVDRELSIDLIHLPAQTAFAPLWAFAAHRALGAIVLHDAPIAAGAAELGEVAAVLARQPGARTFHVVLLGAGERVPPEELRENLSLLDSASLFLLPLDPSKDPSSLLRSLFARIVP